MGAAMQSDQTAEESMMRKTDLALQNDFVIWQIPSNFMSLKLGENVFDIQGLRSSHICSFQKGDRIPSNEQKF